MTGFLRSRFRSLSMVVLVLAGFLFSVLPITSREQESGDGRRLATEAVQPGAGAVTDLR